MRSLNKMRLSAVLVAGLLASAACGGSSGSTGAAGGSSSTTTSSGSAGSSSSASATASSAPKSNVHVGLVFDIGGLGDKSFNDAAYAGLTKAQKNLGVSIKYLEPNSSGSNREQLLRTLAQAGYNPVIGVGFSFQQAVTNVAKQYPKTNFAIIDSDIPLPNVASLEFHAEQSSFLVGAVAALMTKTNTVGFIGGVKVPLLQTFQAGYDAGVKFIDQHAKKSVKTLDTYLTAPPDFSGFTSPDKGKAAALGMYQQNADIVYAAAGGSGTGAFEAAAQTHNYAIGVDSDQYLSAPANLKPVIITSAMKRVDVAVYDFIQAATQGNMWTGAHWFGLNNGGVGISYSGGKINSLKPQIQQITQGIVSGAIKVPTTPSGS